MAVHKLSHDEIMESIVCFPRGFWRARFGCMPICFKDDSIEQAYVRHTAPILKRSIRKVSWVLVVGTLAYLCQFLLPLVFNPKRMSPAALIQIALGLPALTISGSLLLPINFSEQYLVVMGSIIALLCIAFQPYRVAFISGDEWKTAYSVDVHGYIMSDAGTVANICAIVLVAYSLLPVRCHKSVHLIFAIVPMYGLFTLSLPVGTLEGGTFRRLAMLLRLFLILVIGFVGRVQIETMQRCEFFRLHLMSLDLAKEKVLRFMAEHEAEEGPFSIACNRQAESHLPQSSQHHIPMRHDDDATSAMASVPETTSSGRLFTDVGATNGNENLQSRLQRIAELGEREGWLLNPRHLMVQPNEILGSGGFGAVTAGQLHGTAVAVKAPIKTEQDARESKIEALANELRLLRHIRHPNIVIFFGACIEPMENRISIVMERVIGLKFASYVIQARSGDKSYIWYKLVLDIVCALRYLHSQSPQIVHGDLKAGNILIVTTGPQAKLMDFGLSRMLTRCAQPLGGTLSWMAPELLQNSETAPKASSDVFSFGLLVYMLVTGKRPLSGFSNAEVIAMARSGQTAPLDWPPDTAFRAESQDIVERALHIEPAMRPNIDELHEQISTWTVVSPAAKQTVIDALRVRQGQSKSYKTYWQEDLPKLEKHMKGEHSTSGFSHSDALEAIPEDDEFLADRIAPATRFSVPHLVETKLTTKQEMVVAMILHWNIEIPRGSCCVWHAALHVAAEIIRSMQQSKCSSLFRPISSWQCSSCGYLDELDDLDNICQHCFAKDSFERKKHRSNSISSGGRGRKIRGVQKSQVNPCISL